MNPFAFTILVALAVIFIMAVIFFSLMYVLLKSFDGSDFGMDDRDDVFSNLYDKDKRVK
jgi:hypothetical protein